MQWFSVFAVILTITGYVGIIPELAVLNEAPVVLVVGGLLTLGVIMALSRVEP